MAFLRRVRQIGKKLTPTTTPIKTTSREVRGDVLFLAPGDVGKGRVEPISWMRTCEAYAHDGMAVTLATLRVRRPDGVDIEEVWSHYGLDPAFRILTLPTRLGRDASTWEFRTWAGLSALVLAAQTLVRCALRPARNLIVHARAPVLLAPFVLLSRGLPSSRRPLLVFETHALPKIQYGWILRSADLIVVNSEKLAADTRAAFGLEVDHVLHAPLPPFNPVRPQPKDFARKCLDLPTEAVIGCYTGKVTPEHSDFLLSTAVNVRERIHAFRLLLVGGNPESVLWTRRRAAELGIDESILLPGFVPPVAVELYQAAADVLVNYIPHSVATLPYATPSKAYEYQAAERPIAVTDFPLFGEVFGDDGERAIRAPESTPAGLAEGIIHALSLPDGGRAMAERSGAFVRERTWASRSATILKALGV